MSRHVRTLLAAVAGVLLVTGCTAEAEAPPATPPALSKPEARKVLTTYATTLNQARAKESTEDLQAAQTDTLLLLEHGRMLASKKLKPPPVPAAGTRHRRVAARAPAAPQPPVTFTEPKFFIPRLKGYPKWFAVLAMETGSRQREAMVFVRKNAQSGWRGAYSVGVHPDAPMSPKLDKQGYAEALPAGQGGLVVTPAAIAKAHADANQNGKASRLGTVLRPSRWTANLFDTTTADRLEATRLGFTYARNYHPSGYPVFALRAADGGALVWYAVGDELAVTKNPETPRGRWIAPSSDIADLLGKDRIYDTFQASTIREYLATVPVKGKGQAHAIGAEGGPVGGYGN
ncbi:MAG: hypothetical protein GEV11_10995 [Streptosporangiales bacterium]|nr:hypothetical protein [Streptosporangiales bacterium]